jgi:hypothetical protein
MACASTTTSTFTSINNKQTFNSFISEDEHMASMNTLVNAFVHNVQVQDESTISDDHQPFTTYMEAIILQNQALTIHNLSFTAQKKISEGD